MGQKGLNGINNDVEGRCFALRITVSTYLQGLTGTAGPFY
jgi:hypothetical protein